MASLALSTTLFLSAIITHYNWTGQPMANGEYPFEGAAACSSDIPMYSTVIIQGDVYQCLDTGRLGNGYAGACGCLSWIDIYGIDAEAYYGNETEITVIYPGLFFGSENREVP